MILELRHLSRIYKGPDGPVQALDDVSLRLEAGQFLAVQGPSGCGKTTLLLAAGGLLKPTSGTVCVARQDPYALTPGARAKFRAVHIGMIFQQFHLVPYLSVLDNVLAPTLAVPQRDARHRAGELIGRFGLGHRIRHLPAELSTGERQRVALARALMNNPRLILADEPTGNLDPDNAAIVLDHLSTFADGGGAVLLVTHDAAIASRAMRIFKMGGAPP
jgi:ABC-type lipoprotein export system ATPase subunit